MTTYTAIPNGDIDQDSPVTQPLVTLLRDNPIGTAEGATDAPVVAAGWHPYDMSLVGDGNDGEIYDFSVDGAVSSVVSPDFADGYEYMIRLDEMSHTEALGAVLTLELYRETDAAYSVVSSSGNVGNAAVYTGSAHIVMPRLPSRSHKVAWTAPLSDGSTDYITAEGHISDATNQAISKCRIVLDAGNFDAGKIYLYRRREYITG